MRALLLTILAALSGCAAGPRYAKSATSSFDEYYDVHYCQQETAGKPGNLSDRMAECMAAKGWTVTMK